jgi:hypothetical protein
MASDTVDSRPCNGIGNVSPELSDRAGSGESPRDTLREVGRAQCIEHSSTQRLGCYPSRKGGRIGQMVDRVGEKRTEQAQIVTMDTG